MHARVRTVPLAIFALLLAACGSAFAAPSEVSDPAGDFIASCNGHPCASYQDILHASLTDNGSSILCAMTVAAAVPAAPVLETGTKQIVWAWRFDTDPTTFPKGYPQAEGVDSPFDMFVAVVWDGTAFTAQLVDRRPLLTGKDAAITPLTPVISGADLQVTLPTGSLGLPSSFQWRAATNDFQSVSGSSGQFAVDNTQFATLVRNP